MRKRVVVLVVLVVATLSGCTRTLAERGSAGSAAPKSVSSPSAAPVMDTSALGAAAGAGAGAANNTDSAPISK